MENYSINTQDYISRMVSFCSKSGVNLDLSNPKTIQDKLAWLNIYDPNPLKTKCADKILLREYSKDVLGEDICIPILKVYNNTNEINWDELPDRFVIKCNHGSGMNIIVKDKSKLDIKTAVSNLDCWMKDDFSMRNGFEAHYHDIVHKIFVEEYKENKDTGLYDYKFWCFNGEPQMFTINDGNGHGDIMYYRMDGSEWNLYNVKSHSDYVKPSTFDDMVEFARKLSEPFKFVRVDFYEIEGKIYLGELTFTPGALCFKYVDPNDNIRVGNLLKLYNNKKAIVTCLIGNYEKPVDNFSYKPGYDYILFTDTRVDAKSWDVRYINFKNADKLSNTKKQRYVKTHLFKLLPEYDLITYVDANTSIDETLYQYIEKNKNNAITFKKHSKRDCIYDEIKICVSFKKETEENVKPVREKLISEGYPKHNGLFENNVFLFNPKNEDVRKLLKLWWAEIYRYSERDQLSLNYVIWKNHLESIVSVDYSDKLKPKEHTIRK